MSCILINEAYLKCPFIEGHSTPLGEIDGYLSGAFPSLFRDPHGAIKLVVSATLDQCKAFLESGTLARPSYLYRRMDVCRDRLTAHVGERMVSQARRAEAEVDLLTLLVYMEGGDADRFGNDGAAEVNDRRCIAALGKEWSPAGVL